MYIYVLCLAKYLCNYPYIWSGCLILLVNLCISDNRFRHLFLEYFQRIPAGMVSALRMRDEANLGSRWQVRSRVECACSCFSMPGCNNVWYNANEAACYQLTVIPKWIHWLVLFQRIQMPTFNAIINIKLGAVSTQCTLVGAVRCTDMYFDYMHTFC